LAHNSISSLQSHHSRQYHQSRVLKYHPSDTMRAASEHDTETT
jgi:hypothetical protein